MWLGIIFVVLALGFTIWQTVKLVKDIKEKKENK